MRLGSLILAGGRSVRMGRPKESLPFFGETLLARTVATLSRCTEVVVVAARADQSLPALPAGIDRIDDERPDEGPLAAIRGGLQFLLERRTFARGDAAFVAGCDMPFLTADVVHFLRDRLGDASLAIPRVDDVLQPLCAVWRLDALDAVETLLCSGVRMPRRIADAVPTRIVGGEELRAVDPELRALRNVNSPGDYDRAIADGRR
jgi:molybdopterin-guanine dinucleotide biosynthesis protein A